MKEKKFGKRNQNLFPYSTVEFFLHCIGTCRKSPSWDGTFSQAIELLVAKLVTSAFLSSAERRQSNWRRAKKKREMFIFPADTTYCQPTLSRSNDAGTPPPTPSPPPSRYVNLAQVNFWIPSVPPPPGRPNCVGWCFQESWGKWPSRSSGRFCSIPSNSNISRDS